MTGLDSTEAGLLGLISGERALGAVERLSRFHRIKGGPGLIAAAEEAAELLREAGLEPVRTDLPADGRISYGTYRTPRGWVAEQAELVLLSAGGREIPLADGVRQPMALMDYSGSTRDGWSRFRLRWDQAGRGGAPGPEEVVLCAGAGDEAQRAALVEGAAAGLLGGFESVDRRLMSARRWLRMNPLEHREPAFGWSLTPKETELVRDVARQDRAAGGEPRVVVRVRSRFAPTVLPVVEASVGAGGPDRPVVLLVAHLCHPRPSAHDNASGCAAAVEALRALRGLVGPAGHYRLGAEIRLLLTPEVIGTAGYLEAHPELAGRTVAALNLDMVGGPPECGETVLYRSPDGLPTPLNVVAARQLARGELLAGGAAPFREEPHTPGSDHDPLAHPDAGVPAVALIQWEDPYYHTDRDEPDRLEEPGLARAAWTAATTVLAMAEGKPDLRDRALREALDGALAELEGRTGPLAQDEAARWERLARDAGAGPVGTPGGDSRRQALRARLEELGRRDGEAVDHAGEPWAGIKPRRLFRGPLSRTVVWERTGGREPSLYEEIRTGHDVALLAQEAATLSRLDGKRTLGAILGEVAALHGGPEPERLVAHLEQLRRLGLVDWEEAS